MSIDRRVTCDDCKEVIDPVDYILSIAKWWDRHVSSMRRLQLEIRTMTSTLAELRRQARNAKQKARRFEPKEAREARLALLASAKALFAVVRDLERSGAGDDAVRQALVASERARTAAAKLEQLHLSETP